jgi:hypothetical protein
VAGIFSVTVIGERLLAKAVLGGARILIGILVAELKPIGTKRHPSH